MRVALSQIYSLHIRRRLADLFGLKAVPVDVQILNFNLKKQGGLNTGVKTMRNNNYGDAREKTL